MPRLFSLKRLVLILSFTILFLIFKHILNGNDNEQSDENATPEPMTKLTIPNQVRDPTDLCLGDFCISKIDPKRDVVEEMIESFGQRHCGNLYDFMTRSSVNLSLPVCMDLPFALELGNCIVYSFGLV